MRSRRRLILLIFAAVSLLALVIVPEAMAAAGGGSAGFSGGGGGDGGGGSFGGGGGGGGAGKAFALYFIFRALLDIALLGHGLGALVLIALGIAWWFWAYQEPKMERWWQGRNRQGRSHRRATRKRERKVELAAAEAADQNSIFDPESVRDDAMQLFTDVQLAWGSDDRTELKRLIAPELYIEWERRLNDFRRRGWQNKVEPVGRPKVEYVGIERQRRGSGDGSNADGDRVVVRIEAKLRDFVVDRSGQRIKRDGSFTETVRMREYWTLEWSGDHWTLFSIESGAEGDHSLKDKIVQTDWADDGALRDEAMVEGAVADTDKTNVADIADLQFTGDARAAALDLSLADGRFAPDILEIAARRAIAGWALAVDGPDTELHKLATPAVVREMLHPQDPSEQTRMVVRGLEVKRIRITAVDASGDPAKLNLEVDLRGRRYIEERDTTRVLAGSPTRITNFTERWTLALTGDAENPWRIESAQAPAAAL